MWGVYKHTTYNRVVRPPQSFRAVVHTLLRSVLHGRTAGGQPPEAILCIEEALSKHPPPIIAR